MKPRNARLLDDLIHKRPGGGLYKHVRDGHTSDLVEIISELQRQMPQGLISEAVLAFAWLLIEARGEYGSDEARKRDAQRDEILRKLQAATTSAADTAPKRRRRH
jgi:hypothetical protein